jgi:predicted regulator of Ras-like GTPase activity (Roadblock/LC7/MglB family)
MMDALEPLAAIPGVRLALLVSPDGVPVIVRGKVAAPKGGEACTVDENADSLSGLASGWLQGLTASVAPLGWTAPARVVMHAARGTLVMLHAPGSVLLVVLDPGGSAEELRLPMEAAVARMQRILRSRSSAARAPLPQAPGSEISTSSQVDEGSGLVQADSVRKSTHRPFPG